MMADEEKICLREDILSCGLPQMQIEMRFDGLSLAPGEVGGFVHNVANFADREEFASRPSAHQADSRPARHWLIVSKASDTETT